eukprot:8628011-Pyramimonas_sp.AAC.1
MPRHPQRRGSPKEAVPDSKLLHPSGSRGIGYTLVAAVESAHKYEIKLKEALSQKNLAQPPPGFPFSGDADASEDVKHIWEG